MASKILIGIALDGDSEVKRKLQEVGEAGKRSLENIGNKLAGGGGKNTALADLQKQATGLRAALAPLAEASGLGGLLSGAGLGGILGRLAAGPAGIVAGLSGALFGLGKIAEGADRAKGRLASLGDAKGFERLEERAKALGTDVSNLQPRYEKFVASTQELAAKSQTIIHPPGFQQGAVEEAAAGVRILGAGESNSPASQENFGKFDDALLKQIRRDVPSAADAKAIADQFQQQLKTGGLTGDALRGLQAQSPSAANFLTSQLSKPLARGFANPNDLAAALDRGTVQPLDQTKVINAGAKPNEEFDKLAAGSRNVTQAFEALTAAAGRFLEKLGGGPAATGGIDAITKGINAVTDFKPEDALRNIQQNQTNQSSGLLPGSQFGDIFGFLKNALTNPGAIQERARAPDLTRSQLAAQAPAPVPPPAPPQAPIDYTDGRRYSRTLNPNPPPPPVPPGFEREGGGFIIKQGPIPPRPPQTPPPEDYDRVGGLQQPSQVAAVSDAGRDLAAAISEAANAVRNSAAGNTTQTVQQRAGGGAVFGAGTATSDSIPAMLSHGEYVINANAAGKIGLRNLDRLNRAKGGPILLADGGGAPGAGETGLATGTFDVTATDDGGAIINGVKYPPGAPILSIPAIAQALARSRAAKSQESKKTHKSDFVGIFGGHVFDTPGSYAEGGAIGRLPHFASGGIMPDFASGAAPSLSDNLAAPGGGSSSMGHMDVDLRTNHGDFRMMTSAEVARKMNAAARDAADVQTGPRPSWRR